MPLLLMMLLCALFYAGFEIFAGLAGGKINNWLAVVFYNGIGTIIPLIVYFAVTNKGRTTSKGVIFAGLAGVSIMIFSVLLANVFNRGGNLSYVIPVIYGVAILLSSLYGLILLKDKVSALEIIGLILVILGVGCVALAKHKLS
jgi:bacterial/archaeal transporter family protein